MLGELVVKEAPCRTFHATINPYTWFTMDSLEDGWQNLLRSVKERDLCIEKELGRQKQNEDLRQAYAAQGFCLYYRLVFLFHFIIATRLIKITKIWIE